MLTNRSARNCKRLNHNLKILFVFESSNQVQDGRKLASVANSNFWSSCTHLLVSGIIGVASFVDRVAAAGCNMGTAESRRCCLLLAMRSRQAD